MDAGAGARDRAGRRGGRIGEDRGGWRGVSRDERPGRGGGGERGVRGVPSRGVDRHRAVATLQDVLVLQRGIGQQGEHRVDPARVQENRVGQLREDGDVRLAGRPQVADEGRPLALEHGDEPRVAALHRLLEDHVRLVEAGRRPVGRVVADLDRQRGTGRHLAAGCRRTRQGAGGGLDRGLGARGRRRGPLGGRPVAEDEREDHADQHDDCGAEHVPAGPRAAVLLGAQLLAGHDGGRSLAVRRRSGPVAGTRTGGGGGVASSSGIPVTLVRWEGVDERFRRSHIEQTFGSTVGPSHRSQPPQCSRRRTAGEGDQPGTKAPGPLRGKGVTPQPYGRPGPVNDSTEEKQTRHGT